MKKFSANWSVGSSNPTQRDLVRAIKQNQISLNRMKNVHHLGIAQKVSKGRKGGASITVYVTKKESESLIHRSHRIPRYVYCVRPGITRRIRTDVVEINGAPQLLLSGGAVVTSADNERGTAGIVFSFKGENYCITNAHVVSDPGGPTYGVVVAPTTVGGPGTVVYRDPLVPNGHVYSDAALIRITGTPVQPWSSYTIPAVLRDMFRPLTQADVLRQLKCFYIAFDGSGSPRRYDCVFSGLVPTFAPVEVDDFILFYHNFYKFTPNTGGVIAPVDGHSGALVMAAFPDGVYGVGLLFGGIAGSEIWALPAYYCYQKMMEYFK